MAQGNKYQIVPVNFRETSLAVSSSTVYDLDVNDLTDDNGQTVDKLSPFRNLVIYNDGTADLKMFVNNRKGYEIVPAGVIFSVEDDKVNFIKIENVSATATASFYLKLDNDETQKSLLKGILVKNLRS